MNSNRIRIALWTAALLAAGSAPAHAQLDMVEGLFDEVNAVTIFLQRGELANAGKVTGDALRGAGVEVLIDLASGGIADLELGLGAGFMRGYESADPRLDLRTSVRALPTVSLYVSRDAFGTRLGTISGYLGGSFGLVDLWNAQAYDTLGRPWDIEAQTFEFGPSAGVYWTTPAGVGLFGEWGYRNRTFPSARWTLPETDSLPDEWRSLDLSGSYLQFGIQLRVREEAEADENDAITPPAPAGVWALERVNGMRLPVTVDSSAAGKRQLLHAVLRLEPGEGIHRYTLDMDFREVPSRGAAAPRSVSEAGTYTTPADPVAATREHVLAFSPEDAGGARTAERLAGRLYLNWNGHVLVFAPGAAAESGDDGA